MNTKKLIFVSGLVVVALLAIGLLVPLAFAQGPVDNLNPVVGPQVGNQFGASFPQNGVSPMTGGRGQGMMGQRGQGVGTGPGFVDANGDGTCDNFVDNDGDGVCDNMGTGQGGRGGGGFVDNDGDGVCDNFVDNNGDGVCDNMGTGQGGRGAGFVDNNGDGVCDHAGTKQMQGRSPRRGGMSQGQQMGGRWAQQP